MSLNKIFTKQNKCVKCTNMNRLDKYLREDLKTYTTSNSFINEIYKFSQYKIRLMLSAYIYVCYLIIEEGL